MFSGALHCVHAQLCLTLCNPMDCSCTWDFSRQGYWSELPFPTPRSLRDPEIEPVSLALAGGFFTAVPPRRPSPVQSLSRGRLFVTPWTTARQASLSITNSRSLPKLTSIESVMPSNHLILFRPLLLLPSIFLNIRVFSNESALHIRWPKYWEFQLQHQSFQ